ncbi:hypothetical protein OC842_006174 [Tilletia horrida]|uniref:Ubiquitin 3 binding protein But2 C-terminal domain-containing protein n=1 Tax=Tilletia horrida TaxID=155126 RepID=A0AAN6G5Z6_9BASI|nr:hypothetical protein OC842_006174 [Tilletia horrida]
MFANSLPTLVALVTSAATLANAAPLSQRSSGFNISLPLLCDPAPLTTGNFYFIAPDGTTLPAAFEKISVDGFTGQDVLSTDKNNITVPVTSDTEFSFYPCLSFNLASGPRKLASNSSALTYFGQVRRQDKKDQCITALKPDGPYASSLISSKCEKKDSAALEAQWFALTVNDDADTPRWKKYELNLAAHSNGTAYTWEPEIIVDESTQPYTLVGHIVQAVKRDNVGYGLEGYTVHLV